MTPSSLPLPRSALPVLIVGLVAALGASCSESRAGADEVSSSTALEEGAPADEPLAPYQDELLRLAFRAASAFPLEPHAKNRSRTQEEVVTACIRLGQHRRAEGLIENILDWRRGTAYAELGYALASRGREEDARRCAARALEVAAQTATESYEQEWRRDRIRVAVARTYALLGDDLRAAMLEGDVVGSEMGKVAAARARRLAREHVAQELARIEAVAATGNSDLARNSLETVLRLFERFRVDEELAPRLEETLEKTCAVVPRMEHAEALLELAELALREEDAVDALARIARAREVVDGGRWKPEDQLPYLARLAALRHRAGQPEQAHAEAEAALALYDERREEIIDIYRAGALRPLAEAFQTLGKTRVAAALYARAVEEGMHNPNSRPRAMDFAATCCSMARTGVEPDAELASRLRQICEGLGDPW